MELFMKSLVILLVNIGLGYLMCYIVHFFLFHRKEEKLFGRYVLPFTPGLVYRKKTQLLKYLRKTITDYFEFAQKDPRDINFLADYERKVYHEIYPFMRRYFENWLPIDLFKERLNELLSKFTWLVIRTFSRHLLPRFLREWRIYTKLDLLDVKLDIYKIRVYFDQYIYPHILKFSLVYFSIVGVMNMLLFLLLA